MSVYSSISPLHVWSNAKFTKLEGNQSVTSGLEANINFIPEPIISKGHLLPLGEGAFFVVVFCFALVLYVHHLFYHHELQLTICGIVFQPVLTITALSLLCVTSLLLDRVMLCGKDQTAEFKAVTGGHPSLRCRWGSSRLVQLQQSFAVATRPHRL